MVHEEEETWETDEGGLYGPGWSGTRGWVGAGVDGTAEKGEGVDGLEDVDENGKEKGVVDWGFVNGEGYEGEEEEEEESKEDEIGVWTVGKLTRRNGSGR